MAITAILFDLFGTVVGYGDVARGTEESWRGIYDVIQRRGATCKYADFVRDWESNFLEPLLPDHSRSMTPFMAKLMRMLRRYGLPADPDTAREAMFNCLSAWDAYIYLPDDTVATLQALRLRFPTALVSNFDHPPYARGLLDRLGLTMQFDCIVISGEVWVDKPDPRIFRLALDALSCAPDEALFVGDSLSTDMAGSRAVGCRPVLIDMDGRHPGYPGERITRLSELLALM